MVSNSRKENKKKIRKILLKYLIKYVVVSVYNPQINEIIKWGHQSIINMLFKMTKNFIKKSEDDWITHLFSVFFVNYTIIKVSTGITPFRMIYGYEVILPIKLNISMWQTLSWNTVRTHANLITMRAC